MKGSGDEVRRSQSNRDRTERDKHSERRKKEEEDEERRHKERKHREEDRERNHRDGTSLKKSSSDKSDRREQKEAVSEVSRCLNFNYCCRFHDGVYIYIYFFHMQTFTIKEVEVVSEQRSADVKDKDTEVPGRCSSYKNVLALCELCVYFINIFTSSIL